VEFDDCWHPAATALGVGKLMGLNADQLANAVSLALVPHMPIYSRIGVQSMWKGCHSSEGVRNGVWAALLAREGMTGPSEPFEGRDGIIAHDGPYARDLVLPTALNGKTAIEAQHGAGLWYKRFATEGTTQTLHESIMPPLRAWAKPEEIESIDMENTYYSWQEISDPTKWDPQNRETADHSMPYNIARSLIDGYIYYDSFSRDKYLDPKARELMAKITIRPNPNPSFNQVALTVRKKSGEEKKFVADRSKPMTHDDLIAKYNKSADWCKIDKAQADRALKQWMNLKDVKDINEAIATVARLGNPRPLSDKTPPTTRPY
jgi:2-methylcitrate dehydratase